MTTENSALTLSHINFSGYVGHATIFSRMITTACCLVVCLGLELDLVCVFISGYASVVLLLSIVSTVPV